MAFGGQFQAEKNFNRQYHIGTSKYVHIFGR